MDKILIFLSFFCFSGLLFAQLPTVILSGDSGGRTDGSQWSSADLQGKVHLLFYVDPDEKDLNEHVADALKKSKFNKNKFTTVAIINMAATWMPKFAIASALKSKQEKFPDAIYIKDLKKVLVKKWKLKDDSSNVLLFSTSGKLLFNQAGKLAKKQLQDLLVLIKQNIKDI